jgi:rSAM/selenodomain-associated transferase 2
MKISVIIPTLNEEAHLHQALESLPSGAEVIVSDGDSQDRTSEIATKYGARVVKGDRGRGVQMNLGARSSTGDVLLFLHADCTMAPGAFKAIQSALANSNVVGGSFRLRIAHPGLGYRLVAFGSNLRARYMDLPYGDQAIFLRRSDFEAIDGFPETALMEDIELVWRLRKRGKLVSVNEPVTTGSRHWEALGPLPTTLLNWITICLYFLGVSPSRLAPVYHRLRKRRTVETPSDTWVPIPND